MLNRKSLKECLEERASACIQYPKSKQKRVSLCVWDSGDAEAEKIGKKLAEDSGMESLRLHPEEDLTRQVLVRLDEYKKQIDNREIECQEGIYFLFLYDQKKFWNQFSNEEIVQKVKSIFNAFAIEKCRVMEEENLKEPDKNSQEEQNLDLSSFEWRICKEDIQTIKLLLQRAKYEEKLFSSIIKGDFQEQTQVALKSSECNAVREDFSQKFLKSILKQTEQGDVKEIEEKLQELFYPTKFKRDIKKEIPNPSWLPMVGAKNLLGELEKEFRNHSWIDRMITRFKKEYFESELTVQEAMELLFEDNGSFTRVELLRKKVKTETIVNLCDEIVENNKEDMKEAVLSGFSLYDIIYTIPGTVLSIRDRKEQQNEKTEENIAKVLKKKFLFAEATMEDIYNGLGGYFKLYNDCVQNWMEYSWWNALARYLQELKEEVEGEFEALYKAEIVLKNSKIPFLKENLGFVKLAGTSERIYSEKELRNRMKAAISNAEFGRSDLMKVIKASDKYFETLNERNVDIKKQPGIYLFLSPSCGLAEQDVEDLMEKKECLFKWRLVESKFLPAKIIFQLRVYALNKEEKVSNEI